MMTDLERAIDVCENVMASITFDLHYNKLSGHEALQQRLAVRKCIDAIRELWLANGETEEA